MSLKTDAIVFGDIETIVRSLIEVGCHHPCSLSNSGKYYIVFPNTVVSGTMMNKISTVLKHFYSDSKTVTVSANSWHERMDSLAITVVMRE